MKIIYMWGVCDPDGTSCLFTHKPIKWDDHGWDNVDQSDYSEESSCPLNENNLFPKDKPQKFRLVLVQDEDDITSIPADE